MMYSVYEAATCYVFVERPPPPMTLMVPRAPALHCTSGSWAGQGGGPTLEWNADWGSEDPIQTVWGQPWRLQSGWRTLADGRKRLQWKGQLLIGRMVCQGT
uniref:Uncharacterized protein n=1 Tax=Eutreptiella gymnastica TaxID=73025 RepID=A0A7S4FP18_9EUGL